MNIFKQYGQLLDCMDTMSKDIQKLASIISDQQKQIQTLTSCVEQLQDIAWIDLEKDLK